MTPKNETTNLILTLIITSLVVAGGFGIIKRFMPSLESSSNSSDNEINPNNAVTLAEVKNVPEGLFNYGGSTTWAPIRQKVDNVIHIVHPNFQLRYTHPISGNPGSGTGIKMLLNNQLSFSQSSRNLKPEEREEAKQRGLTLQEIPVAIDGIAIAVNLNLNVPGLTISQIKHIYTGKIKNWSEVGGPNLTITPYSRTKESGGTVEFFIENVMQKEEFGNNIEYVYETTEGLRKVIANEGGIYYASAPEVVPQCEIKSLPIGINSNQFVAPYQLPYIPPSSQCPSKRNLVNKTAFQSGEYPLTRRLFVIVKKDIQENNTTNFQANLDEIAGLKYAELLLTNQGQKLIEDAGFVPLR